MKVAVLGKSRFNGILEEQLSKEGLSPVFIEDLDEIKSISGEVGEFLIRTQTDTVEAACVIAVMEPAVLDDIGNTKENGKPVVILLDYP